MARKGISQVTILLFLKMKKKSQEYRKRKMKNARTGLKGTSSTSQKKSRQKRKQEWNINMKRMKTNRRKNNLRTQNIAQKRKDLNRNRFFGKGGVDRGRSLQTLKPNIEHRSPNHRQNRTSRKKLQPPRDSAHFFSSESYISTCWGTDCSQAKEIRYSWYLTVLKLTENQQHCLLILYTESYRSLSDWT